MTMQKKASESSNRRDVKKNNESSEDRMNRYDRFLTPFKSLAIGTIVLTAGVDRAMADQSRALQSLSDNPTGLTPAFPNQRAEIIGKSPTEPYIPAPRPEWLSPPKGPTVEELWPRLHEQMVKSSGEKGEASKNSLQGEAQGRYNGETSSEKENPLSPNEKKIATLKAVTEKAGKDPEFAARVRRMLAESRPPSEQDKGTEHLTPEKIDPEVLENTKRKLYEACLQWLSVKGVLGSTTITKGALSGEGTVVELSLQADNNCGGTVDNVQFNAGITYTCPSQCKPGDGGSVGEVGGQAAYENGTPSTIENGQLSQAQIITYAFCQQVDSNGDVTAILPPSSVSALVTTLGTYNGNVVQSLVQPVSFVS
jgi:hypothetical protein